MSRRKRAGVIHIKAKRKFWSGEITALCGAVSPRGTYDTSVLGVFFRGERCSDCDRIHRQQKNRKR